MELASAASHSCTRSQGQAAVSRSAVGSIIIAQTDVARPFAAGADGCGLVCRLPAQHPRARTPALSCRARAIVAAQTRLPAWAEMRGAGNGPKRCRESLSREMMRGRGEVGRCPRPRDCLLLRHWGWLPCGCLVAESQSHVRELDLPSSSPAAAAASRRSGARGGRWASETWNSFVA